MCKYAPLRRVKISLPQNGPREKSCTTGEMGDSGVLLKAVSKYSGGIGVALIELSMIQEPRKLNTSSVMRCLLYP